MKMWYDREATRWLEALPVGNGHLGAVVFGGVQRERLALTEATCWSGGPGDANDNPRSRELLPEVRRLLFEERFDCAAPLVEEMLGNKGNYGTHLPFGNINLEFRAAAAKMTAYRRELDLASGVVSMEYRQGATTFRREVLASNPDRILAVRLTADREGCLDFSVSMDGETNPCEVKPLEDMLVLKGDARESLHSDGQTGVALHGRLRVVAEGGNLSVEGDTLRVDGATSATLYASIGTDLFGFDAWADCRRALDAAAAKGWEALKADHVQDHQTLFNRVALDLGGHEREKLPLDRRLEELRNGADDPALDALFFQFGRYLLIASSRENSRILNNLQGIWNDGRASSMPWTCDYHIDINTQMNYWPAEVTNLSECHDALFQWLEERLIPSGRKTAQIMYGHDGWVAHVVCNAWGYSSPGWEARWAHFVTGGVWIATHFWERYCFTGDKAFLRDHAYPVLKEAARFFEQHLVGHPTKGWLVTGPGISPENVLKTKDGQVSPVSMGPTCDVEMMRELFSACVEASAALGVDEALCAVWQKILGKLPPLQIGADGRLQEWLEDYEEGEPEHRHVTHLNALYPFGQITPQDTPELAAAAERVIDHKVNHPDFEAVEWNLAWFIAFYARLRHPGKAHAYLQELLAEATETNLFTFSQGGIAGAEWPVMVVDGNTGVTAGVAEMLVQSHRGNIDLLPALPAQWPTGSVSGLCARGGFEVSIDWKDGALVSAEIKSKLGGRLDLAYGDRQVTIDTQAGEVMKFDACLHVLCN